MSEEKMNQVEEQCKCDKVDILSFDFFVTEQCNLNCSYCFHKKSDNTMSIEDGKKVLDRMKQINPKSMLITFFGGEPLLYPDRVFEWAKYAKTLWQDEKDAQGNDCQTVGFHVVTNGTYFDQVMFEEYKKLNFTFQLSIDGDKITMQECRGGDFDKIIENAKSILAVLPKSSVRMTYTPKTVGRLAMNVKFLHELGFSRIMHHATMEDEWNDEALSAYAYQLYNVFRYRRSVNRSNRSLDIRFIDRALQILNDEHPQEVEFCKAGKSYIAVLPNGDVYPCHRAASNRIFKLGNIFNEKRPFIRGVFLNLDKEFTGCKFKCEAAGTCHSCPITHFLVNKDLTVPLQKNGYCKICITEHNLAQQFLPVELSDRRDRLAKIQGSVLADMAAQLDYIEKALYVLVDRGKDK